MEYRINFRILTFVFKSKLDELPIYLAELLIRENPNRMLRSNTSLRFDIPKTYTKAGQKSFSYAGPILWNNLPVNIKTASSLISFKRLLKTFYFKIVYDV